ncbi:MAG: IclR family transcriptional regulator C-terminal domain-containing protein [Nocardioides sp.]
MAGYAITRDELEIGLCGIAAPVHNGHGDVVAALGLSGPTPASKHVSSGAVS